MTARGPADLKRGGAATDANNVDARLRENALAALLAAAAISALAWIGLSEFAWNDYGKEAAPAVAALIHGHLGSFFGLAPAYGSSLLMRAPFALLADLWNGGALGAYRMLAVPCLLASAALALYLNAWMRARGRPLTHRTLAVALCVANPLTLLSLEIGHPEDLLGGVLCVAAVLAAADGRWRWAGLALGAAVADKPWAVLAVGPVLLALAHRRVAAMTIAGAVAAAFTLPLLLLSGGAFASSLTTAASTGTGAGTVFQPWQIWWFLGHLAHPAAQASAAYPPGARVAPGWVSQLSHPLIVSLALPGSVALWLRRRAHPRSTHSRAGIPGGDALLLLCLLLLLRCMLDPWDNVYYPLPFILALLTWETRRRRPALLAFAATAAVIGGHHWLAIVATPDVQAAFFAAWTVPLALWLGWRLYGPVRVSAGAGESEGEESDGAAQPTTVSAFGSRLRLRQPDAVSTTRSSILTPSSPGR